MQHSLSVARLPNTIEIYTGTWHMRFEIENCHGRFRRIHVTIDRESYLRCLLLFMWYQTWHTNAYVANTVLYKNVCENIPQR